jgi:hypothetical protein
MRTTLVMPSPREGNQKNIAASVQTMRSMNGTLYTYVKSKRDRKVHVWDFLVTKDKVREVEEFMKLYAGNLARITDHEGTLHLGYLTANPYDFEGQGGSNERYGWTLTLEEKV